MKTIKIPDAEVRKQPEMDKKAWLAWYKARGIEADLIVSVKYDSRREVTLYEVREVEQ